VGSQVAAFFIHLRWPYNLLVLSGGYLLGGLYRPEVDAIPFLIQLLNVHLLLNGGVTAYNSYYDEDDGPIGGIEHPPKMAPWMLPAALFVQAIGLAVATLEGPIFVGIFATTMALSILYSSRATRWKGRPLLSLSCVGIGTGVATFLMGFLAGGDGGIDARIVAASGGVAVLLLAMYPVSQVFQIDEDRSKGTRTFAVAYGLHGVRWFFVVATTVGLATVSITLGIGSPGLGVAFLAVGAAGALANGVVLFQLEGTRAEYQKVMRMKYAAALSFELLVAAALLARAHR
jgi:4-hydroxybenzoate polyprenyltransferase